MKNPLRRSEESAADTLQNDLRHALRTAEAARPYAPPQHPDRISATSQVMCEAISKVLIDTAAGIDERIVQLKARVKDVLDHVAAIEEGVANFKDGMKEAADSLTQKVQEVMAHYEDITSKLQQSPFNGGDMPKFLEPPTQQESQTQ